MMYYKPTPLFRADVREIAHGLIIPYTLKFSRWINFRVFRELVCIRENKNRKKFIWLVWERGTLCSREN